MLDITDQKSEKAIFLSALDFDQILKHKNLCDKTKFWFVPQFFVVVTFTVREKMEV